MQASVGSSILPRSTTEVAMKINSIGTFTTATEFVPLFPPKDKIFKPLVIRQFDYEDREVETQEPAGGTSTQAEGGITPQDKQTTASETQ